MTDLVQMQTTGNGGTDTFEVGIDTAAGHALVATITMWMAGDNPVAITAVEDDAGNIWQFSAAQQSQSPPAAGSYSANTDLYGFSAGAIMLPSGNGGSTKAITEVTVTFSEIVSSFGEVNVQEFENLPAGAVLLTAKSDNTNAVAVTSYDTPVLAVPSTSLAVCYTSFAGEFTAVGPAGWTMIESIDTIGAYNLAAPAGSVGAAFTAAVGGDVPSSAILAIGVRPPAAGAVSPALADAIRPGRLFPSVGRG